MVTIDTFVRYSKAFMHACVGIFFLAVAWCLISLSAAVVRYIDEATPANTVDYGFTVDGQDKSLTIGVHGTSEHNVNDHPTVAPADGLKDK